MRFFSRLWRYFKIVALTTALTESALLFTLAYYTHDPTDGMLAAILFSLGIDFVGKIDD